MSYRATKSGIAAEAQKKVKLSSVYETIAHRRVYCLTLSTETVTELKYF